MNILANQYSFVAVAVGLLVVSGMILLTNKPKRNDYFAYAAIVIGIIAAWGTLHPRQTPLMEDALKVQAMIGSGTPVLLEFQSPY